MQLLAFLNTFRQPELGRVLRRVALLQNLNRHYFLLHRFANHIIFALPLNHSSLQVVLTLLQQRLGRSLASLPEGVRYAQHVQALVAYRFRRSLAQCDQCGYVLVASRDAFEAVEVAGGAVDRVVKAEQRFVRRQARPTAEMRRWPHSYAISIKN